MKPENYDKIHEEKIEVESDIAGITKKFHAEVDGYERGDVWMFPENQSEFGYALYFQIDWSNRTFQIKKALIGDGRNFEDVMSKHTVLQMHRQYYKTIDAFKNFLSQYTSLNLNELKR